MWHFHRHVPAVSDYDCSNSALWTPYCWSCGSSSVNVNSVRPPAVKEPEPSSLSFYFVMLFGPCTTTFQWLINNAWAAGLCSVVYADILLEQFEPFDCQLCINVCVQKLLHPVWVRLKGSKGLRTGSSHHCKRSRCLRWMTRHDRGFVLIRFLLWLHW